MRYYHKLIITLKRHLLLLGVLLVCMAIFAFKVIKNDEKAHYYDYDNLRELYGSGDQSLWPEPVLDSTINKDEFEDIGLLPKVNYPESNPYSKEKAELGRELFFDKRLSKSGEIACASCHDPEKAWTDPKRKSIGHDGLEGARNAMSIVNAAHFEKFFWDGRAKNLEHQAKFPIEDPVEMNQPIAIAVDSIRSIANYHVKFKEAFGEKEITESLVFDAIATFERTLVSNTSKFDEFISGNPEVYTDEEVLGLHLYRTKANCISCHNTPLFSDNKFHNDGQSLFGSRHQDLGLFEVTKDSLDMGKFKTPSLREVNETGPWMHNGNFPNLMDIIDYYNLGNPAPIQKTVLKTYDGQLPKNSPILGDLGLSDQEKKALIAFLKTLSSDYVK